MYMQKKNLIITLNKKCKEKTALLISIAHRTASCCLELAVCKEFDSAIQECAGHRGIEVLRQGLNVQPHRECIGLADFSSMLKRFFSKYCLE